MGETFRPYVSATSQEREFTFRSVTLGLIFGFFFAIANAYLALKLGTTVSASIPAAILAMGVSRLFRKKTSVLENNIIQTISTVGEGLAAGVIFTIPALIILGDPPSIGRIFLLSALGGILGILLMIPMRRHIIVQEHNKLPFPEGTACASILKLGDKSGKNSIAALWGALAAAVYKICSNGLFLWNEVATWTFNFYEKTVFSLDATPALLGVGYVIGQRVSLAMFSGGIFAWWVLIPIIKIFGLGQGSIYPSTMAIAEMSSDDIWNHYIRYIGAGTLATGGLLSLIKIFPIVGASIKTGITELYSGFWSRKHIKRTDRDISMAWLLLGSLAIVLFLWLDPKIPMNLFTVVLLTVLSFFFVGVTSLTVGLVGSTSNPVSGMTITVLLITCICFVLLGWTESLYLISAITMGCVSCCAVCMAGTTSQDLKTGYLLGATPQKQQIAEILGVVIPSIALGFTVYILNQAYHIGSTAMPAPQASLMAMIVKGVISGQLPYPLFATGALFGVALAFLRAPILAVALGLYLPLSLTTPVVLGGVIRAIIERKKTNEAVEERGNLFASGLIGGDACVGIVLALLTVLKVIPPEAPAFFADWVSILTFGLLGSLFFCATRSK
jgi:putative OPT family oligopeptide transporter